MSRAAAPVRSRRAIALALLVALLGLWHPVGAHLRAASFLLRFMDPDGHSLLADIHRHPIDEVAFDLPGSRARLYLPTDLARPPGMVLVHGVHFKGIDEPRLQRFARTVAASGIAVLTPELNELCDYRVEPASIDTIGAAAKALSAKVGTRVGVMGLSFAGGLSLLAAMDPRYESTIAFVVTIGAHDDLGRVLRFYASNEASRPDGTMMSLQAHPYGPVIVLYSHAEDFFAPADVVAARDALRAWLHEDWGGARARATGLSTDGAEKMGRVFARDTAALTPLLRDEIARLEPAFAAVSPGSRLGALHVPAFLLHGAGDSVIPSTETEWLARDAPRAMLRDVLVSRAIEHVELESKTPLREELALVHFMSDVLDAAEDERR
jgi:dienelactone hydrolase